MRTPQGVTYTTAELDGGGTTTGVLLGTGAALLEGGSGTDVAGVVSVAVTGQMVVYSVVTVVTTVDSAGQAVTVGAQLQWAVSEKHCSSNRIQITW